MRLHENNLQRVKLTRPDAWEGKRDREQTRMRAIAARQLGHQLKHGSRVPIDLSFAPLADKAGPGGQETKQHPHPDLSNPDI